mgnify:CR=1 FL=1
MAWFVNLFRYSCLLCKTSVSLCWKGPNQFNAKQYSFQTLSNGPVINQRFGRKSLPQLSIYLVYCSNTVLIHDIFQALPHFVVN